MGVQLAIGELVAADPAAEEAAGRQHTQLQLRSGGARAAPGPRRAADRGSTARSLRWPAAAAGAQMEENMSAVIFLLL